MKKIISFKFSVYSLLILFALVILFHFLVLFSVFPHNIVWGGRMTSFSELLMFECVSILLNGLFIVVVLLKAGLLKWKVNNSFLQILLWIMVTVFALNTLGNLLSKNEFEKIVFTPLTLLLAFLCMRAALASKEELI